MPVARSLAGITGGALVVAIISCQVVYPLDDLPGLDASSEDASNEHDAGSLVEGGSAADAASDAAVRYASAVLADHPVAYWRFDEPAGSPVALDSTDGGHTLTFVGATVRFSVPGALASDPLDTAISFTPKSSSDPMSYADGGPIFQFAGRAAFSFEGWIAPAVLTTKGPYIQILGNCDPGSPPEYGYNFSIPPPNAQGEQCLLFQRADDGGNSDSLGPCGSFLSLGTWTQFVVTFDGGTLILYTNGAKTGSLPSTRMLAADANVPFTIGGAHGAFAGDVDEIAVYDYDLTPAQVAGHYAASR